MHFNLLPWRAKRDQRRQSQFYGLVMASGMLTGLIQAWVLSGWQTLADEQAMQVNALEARLAEFEAAETQRAAKDQSARASDEHIQEALGLLQTLHQTSTPVGAWLVDLMAMRPRGVWIEQMALRPIVKVSESTVSGPLIARWRVDLSGHAVNDRGGSMYQEALAERFGQAPQPNHESASIWSTNTDRMGDGEENTLDLAQSFGVETFSMAQWIENP